MPKKDTIGKPDAHPEADVIEQEATETEEQVSEESQVIVHCSCRAGIWGLGIRIWKSTYLFAIGSDHCSDLLHAENITMAPEWTWLMPGQRTRFTLIFSGLPKSCTAFDMREVISEPYGFEVKGIRRNSMDVYQVEIA